MGPVTDAASAAAETLAEYDPARRAIVPTQGLGRASGRGCQLPARSPPRVSGSVRRRSDPRAEQRSARILSCPGCDPERGTRCHAGRGPALHRGGPSGGRAPAGARPVRGCPFIDVLAPIFTLQVAAYVVQEVAEALATG